MCLAVYLASSIPVATSKWDQERPKFYLESVSKAKDREAIARFSAPNVYYVGSHEGCGCGFLKDGEAGEDLTICQENYVALGKLIEEILDQGAKVELFACWEGDQARSPEFIDELTLAQLLAPAFEFREHQFIRLVSP